MKTRALETRFAWLLVLCTLPVFGVALVLAFQAGVSRYAMAAGVLAQIFIVLAAALHTRMKLAARLRALASIVEAAKNGDYAIKARRESAGSALADLVDSINALSDELSQEKIQTEEKRVLLNKVIEQINVGVITADDTGRIQSVNLAAKRILHYTHAERPQHVDQLPWSNGEREPSNRLISVQQHQHIQRVFLQQDQYRDGGAPQQLFLLTEMDTLLRQEQFKSWEDLVRVISHEINNSLTPIQSLSESMASLIKTSHASDEDKADLTESAEIISERARSLTEFIGRYRNLTHLEKPVTHATAIHSVIETVLPLFHGANIKFDAKAVLMCDVDQSQIQQVLINLIKNAIEAMVDDATPRDSEGTVIHIRVYRVESEKNYAVISIEDNGVGIANVNNLFIPFYSTKQGGSGIGLVLSRQIVERHGGELSVFNKRDGRGCIAQLKLPLVDGKP